MSVERLEPGLVAVDGLGGLEAVCCLLTEDERPLPGAAGFVDWRLCGALSRVLKSGFFRGLPGEHLLVPTDGRLPSPKLFAVGLGRGAGVTTLGLEHALEDAARMLKDAGVRSVALALPGLPKAVEAVRAEAVERAFVAHFQGRVALFG